MRVKSIEQSQSLLLAREFAKAHGLNQNPPQNFRMGITGEEYLSARQSYDDSDG